MSLFTLCDIPHDSHSFLITNHSPNVRATLTAIKKYFCLHLQKKKDSRAQSYNLFDVASDAIIYLS